MSLKFNNILDEYLPRSKEVNSFELTQAINGILFKATISGDDKESPLNSSTRSREDIFKMDRDGMPDPRRSIEIELQWLVSVYSPKILNEIHSMLAVKCFIKTERKINNYF